MRPLSIDAERVIDDLRELDRRTGGARGARRVAWTQEWRVARGFLTELLSELGIEPELDEALNLWARLEGESGAALGIGSHLDSVPNGGWLDGALGVMAAVGVLRAWARRRHRPPRTLALIDWADEEGARFGRSLFGSSAFAGTLEPRELRRLRDRDGNRMPDVLREWGVEPDRTLAAGRRAAGLSGYLELHIEQGPVLELEGLRAAAVRGCVGVERHRLRFAGQAAHAGTTPMDRRRDAGLAAATAALALERIGGAYGGTATTGALTLEPGIATATAGRADLLVDLRHADGSALAEMLAASRVAARTAARERGCRVSSQRIWRIEPTAFDARLVEHARAACAEAAGSNRVLTSGALHDAAAVAGAVPAAMIFAPSTGGISHASTEDTPHNDLVAAIHAFGLLVEGVIDD